MAKVIESLLVGHQGPVGAVLVVALAVGHGIPGLPLAMEEGVRVGPPLQQRLDGRPAVEKTGRSQGAPPSGHLQRPQPPLEERQGPAPAPLHQAEEERKE